MPVTRARIVTHRARQSENWFQTNTITMSTEQEQRNNAARGSLRLAPNVEEIEEHKSKLPRQFVNFTFYRARPEWRLLDETEKDRCKEDFAKTIDEFRKHLLIHT